MKKRLLALIALLGLLLCSCQVVIYVPEAPRGPGYSMMPSLQPELMVHYIDVGQADCILLQCGGKSLLIDGGNVDDGRKVVTYLQEQGISELDTVICTHAHEDHVGGLPAVLAVFPVHKVYAPTKTYASSCFDDFVRYVEQQRLEITAPVPGDSFYLGGAKVTVLGPLRTYSATNNTSIVVKVVFGSSSFLFTGDMEVLAENELLDSGAGVKADVLKVGHHGSNTSTGYRFLYEVNPEYAVISVGTGNAFGHPHEEPLSRLEQAGVTQFRTDQLGTVIAVSDGLTITFRWENQSANPQWVEYGGPMVFIGNKTTRLLHIPSCSNLPAEKNRALFDSLSQALEEGYIPCKSCIAG